MVFEKGAGWARGWGTPALAPAPAPIPALSPDPAPAPAFALESFFPFPWRLPHLDIKGDTRSDCEQAVRVRGTVDDH